MTTLGTKNFFNKSTMLSLFIFLNILDLITTWFNCNNGAEEVNPIVLYFVQNTGLSVIMSLIILKLIIVIVLMKIKGLERALAFGNIALAVVVASNINQTIQILS